MPRKYIKRESQKRIPPGQPRKKLIVSGLKPGEQGYWASPEQFEELQKGGYTFVNRTDVEVGVDGNGNTDLGSVVSQVVDRSTGERHYLMKIPKEWYEENQREKQRAIDQRERQILNPAENQYSDGTSINNEFRR